jgi:hypothetical protein
LRRGPAVSLRVLSYWDELSPPILAETVRDEWEVWIGSSSVRMWLSCRAVASLTQAQIPIEKCR